MIHKLRKVLYLQLNFLVALMIQIGTNQREIFIEQILGGFKSDASNILRDVLPSQHQCVAVLKEYHQIAKVNRDFCPELLLLN